MPWHRDNGLEHKLDKMGIEYEYRSRIKIADVKLAASLQNNARIGQPLNVEVAERYARSLGTGDSLPAIVLRPNMQIICGNHRAYAAEKSAKTIAGYVLLNATKQQIESIKRTDNFKHGLKLSDEEARLHIVYMHFEHDFSAKELADETGFKNKDVQNIIRAEKQRRELEGQGHLTDHLNQTTLLKIHTIGGRALKAKVAVCKLARSLRLNNEQVNDLVGRVNATKSERDSVAAIKSFGAEITQIRSTPADSKCNTPKRTQFRSHLISKKGFYNFLMTGNDGAEFESFEDLQVDDPLEQQELSRKIDKMMAQLRKIKNSKKKKK